MRAAKKKALTALATPATPRPPPSSHTNVNAAARPSACAARISIFRNPQSAILSKSPIIEELKDSEIVLAENQPQFLPLPALVHYDSEGDISVSTRWTPSDEERAAIAEGGDIFISQKTHGRPFQAVRVQAEPPQELMAALAANAQS